MTNNPSISRRETAESEGFERDAQRSGKVLKPASFTMDYLAEAIFWVDPDSRIVDVNETACSMLGYTREELLSLTVLEIDPNFTADRWTSVWKTFKGQGKITLETAPRTKGGRIIHVEIMASHLCLEGRELACAFARDITERKVMLEQLEKSERKHRRLHESMRDGFVFVDMTGAIKEYNETYRTMLGYHPDEIEALTYVDITPGNWHAFEQGIVENQILPNGYSEVYEKEYRRKDGTVFPVELRTFLIKDEEGRPEGMWAIVRDITGRKLVEERLAASLREKETLLRELYHRTKNNMQVISNLIDLQALSVSDEQTLRLFKETQNRIKAMALVHEKLYQSKDLSNLGLKEYLSDLAHTVMGSYQLNENRIALHLDIESISVSIDTAMVCGLIINELMSNSLKHAFPGNRSGDLCLIVCRSAEGRIEMRFSDSGIGLPQAFDFRNTQTLGLTLVKNLSEKQLKGKIRLTTEGRTEFRIVF